MCKCVYFCATKQADVQMHRPLWLGSQLSAPVFALWGADNCEQMFTIQYQPQLRANVHNSIAAAPAATIVRECPRFGIKSGTLGGLWLWSYYWILWKGKMLLIKERRFYWWLKQCRGFFLPPHCNDEYFFHQIEWSRKKASRVNGKTNLWSGWTVFRKNAIHESWRERVYMICCNCSFFCASSHWLLGNVWPHW